MTIRKAKEKDIPKIMELLAEVNRVHYEGRSDIFKLGCKYSEEEISAIIKNEKTPVLVAVDQDDVPMGYCFCIFKRYENDSILTDIKTLYIDDLCVSSALRGRHIGKELYQAALSLAKEEGCYNVTLNVWTCNPVAMRFYESCGLTPQKLVMEYVIE